MTTYSPPTGGRHRAAVAEPAQLTAAPAYATFEKPAAGPYPTPLPARYVPPIIHWEPPAEPPLRWPIVPAVAFFGILGSLFARWQMRKARRLGYSTRTYWGAWAIGFSLHAVLAVGSAVALNSWTVHNLKTQLAQVDFQIDGVHEHVVVDGCHGISTSLFTGDGTYQCSITLPDGTHQHLSAVMRARTLVDVTTL